MPLISKYRELMNRTFKSLLIVILTGLPIAFVSAQKYEFEYREKEQEQPEGTVSRHFLGEQIATKMYLLKRNYTSSVMDEITRVESTQIEKPSIYYSVNKVNKYIKKSLKKGVITETQAMETLNKVLDIALNIRYQQTNELEQELWGVKDPEAIASLFQEDIIMD